MKTVQICKGITATLSDKKYNEFIAATIATSDRISFTNSTHPDMNWRDVLYCIDTMFYYEDEAWEKFCS